MSFMLSNVTFGTAVTLIRDVSALFHGHWKGLFLLPHRGSSRRGSVQAVNCSALHKNERRSMADPAPLGVPSMQSHANSRKTKRKVWVLMGLLSTITMGSNAEAGQVRAGAGMSVGIVIPPHCIEVIGADEQLESGLREKRLLCTQKTGRGKPVRVVIAGHVQFTQGESNAVHRAGFE